MEDEVITTDGGQAAEGENGADNQGESQNDGASEQGAEGADNSEGENTESGDEADADGSEADASKDDKQKNDKSKSKPTPQADEEPKTRKRNIDFILERKNRKIEKLQKKAAEPAEADQDADEDDGIDDADAEVIDRRVQAHLKPLLEKQMQEEDAAEIGAFVKENPDFAKYADKVKKFAQHPTRKGIPIQTLFYEVAGPDLLKIGAERARKAGNEAKKTQSGGGAGARGTDTTKDIWSMPEADFLAEQEAVRSKRRE